MDVSRRDLIKLGTTAAAAGGLLAAQVAQAQALRAEPSRCSRRP
jgi:hypothetical protein